MRLIMEHFVTDEYSLLLLSVTFFSLSLLNNNLEEEKRKIKHPDTARVIFETMYYINVTNRTIKCDPSLKTTGNRTIK